MKKLSYSIKIQESPEKVYDTMLGISSKQTYEQWTTAFNPTSTYEGKFEKGEKLLFTGTDNSGKKEGMISKVVEIIPNKFVSIEHYGMLKNNKEVTTGPEVESWAGALENYRFEKTEDGTFVSVEVDTVEDHVDYFDKAWPQALEKLKAICEKKNKPVSSL
jgi:hypothetical protein